MLPRSLVSHEAHAGTVRTIVFTLLLTLCASLVPSGAVARATPGSGRAPTMLILDASGSMVRDAPGGGTRMQQARQAAIRFVDSLSAGQSLGLMVFGTGTGNTDAEKSAGCRDVRTLFPPGPVDKAAMRASIEGIRESGYTPLGLAVERAAAELGEGEANIVLVSDGVDSCAPPPGCDRVGDVVRKHPGLTVHAIGFAVDADEEAQEELACIAETGGGRYVTASNADQLASQLQWATDPQLLNDTVAPGGVNALRIGMSLQEALAAEPSLQISDPSAQTVYGECSYASMRFIDGRLYDIYPTSPWPTAEGVEVGAPLEAATAVYGTPFRSGSGRLGNYEIYPVTPGSSEGYRIYSENGMITRIVVCACGPGAASGPIVEVSFEGIGEVRLGMTAEEFLAAFPDAQYWGGEGFTRPLGSLREELAAGSGLGHVSTCPMTVSPYEPTVGSIPLEVFIIDGEVRGITTYFASAPLNLRTPGGLDGNASLVQLTGEFGQLSRFSAPAGERWVAADRSGRTMHLHYNQLHHGVAAVSVLAPEYTTLPEARDWSPCGQIVHRVEGRV